MQVTVSGRHLDVPDALREYAEEKSGKFERFYDRVQTATVVFDLDAGRHHCEIIARADHHMTFVAKEAHEDAFASFDLAAKELERQLRRHKERYRNRKHSGGGRTEPPHGGDGAGMDEDDGLAVEGIEP